MSTTALHARLCFNPQFALGTFKLNTSRVMVKPARANFMYRLAKFVLSTPTALTMHNVPSTMQTAMELAEAVPLNQYSARCAKNASVCQRMSLAGRAHVPRAVANRKLSKNDLAVCSQASGDKCSVLTYQRRSKRSEITLW